MEKTKIKDGKYDYSKSNYVLRLYCLDLKHSFFSLNSKRKVVLSCFFFDYYIITWKHLKQLYSDTAVKKIQMTTATVKYIRQYQLIFSSVLKNNITFWYRAHLSLYLNNKKILPFPASLNHSKITHEI